MSPRVSLPGADELFRATSARTAEADETRSGEPLADVHPREAEQRGVDRPASGRSARAREPRRGGVERTSTGRERHEEKITVYVSAAELVDLERARLHLRADHGIAVDRGRIVREALSVLLADFEAKQDESILVRRLTQG